MSDRIRFGEPIELTLPPEKLPSASLLVQQVVTKRDSSFQVYIVKEAYDKAWRHVSKSRHTECGGILAGHPFRTHDRDITFVVIVDTIPQGSDNRSIGHFTVSPAEIAEARVTLERKGYFAVGWYHSHPGHGVFLSGQDMTIVRSIYNSHWHVAWVIDPLRQEEVFFRGSKGERLTRQYLLVEEPEFVRASAFYTKADEERKAGDARRRFARTRFRQLKDELDNNPKLAHWQETGRYQDVLNALDELADDDAKISPEKTAIISSSEASVIT